MADPLVTPAIVGFAVSTFLTEVITAAKMAYNCKDECNELAAKLEDIKPLVIEVEKNKKKGNEACSKWLANFTGLLQRAEVVTKECIQETVSGKAKRVLKFWRWKKLPSRVSKVNRQIEEARANASLVALGILLSMNTPNAISSMNPPHVTSSLGFVKQGTPSLIVGVDEHFNKLKTSILLSHGKDRANYFGLQGRGGAGKTLLAQMLNDDDDIQKKYGKDSIIWITVGLDARVADLYEKMGKSCILDDGVSDRLKLIKNQEEQRICLKNEFAEKVFLILDDVWVNQCDHYEMMYWLDIANTPGSATFITSRSKSALCRAHAEVEVVLSLPEEESWKLFCSYAFDNEAASLETIPEKLARDVCEECQGLPLALKVIGSAMMTKVTVEEWRSALSDLRQSKSILDSNVDDELFGRLELSYNELKHDATKICFLYFAAFPEDYKMPVKDLFNVWVGEGLFGSDLSAIEAENKARAHLEILVKRSMIYWNREEECAQIHDILRDLALYIIGKAKVGECAYECFFQSQKDSASFPRRELLQYLKRMSFMNCNIFQWSQSLQAPNLRVCILSQISYIEKRVPADFVNNMTSLKFLNLSHNDFSSQGKFPSFKRLISLTHLDLQGCQLNELPESISNLNNLLCLNLRLCKSLDELPKTIGNFEYLTNLDFGGCGSLKELPQSIGNLECLIDLDLGGCGSLKELPHSIGKLECLTNLNLGGCGSLKELPHSIGNLECLTNLNLGGCRSLKEFPESIGNLKCLMNLNLRGCRSLEELLENIGKLECLTDLYLGGCGSLEELPESIGKLECLTDLYLTGCRSLEELPESIGSLKCLTDFFLGECGSLKELPESIGKLECLTHLNVGGCGSLKKLPESIGNLKCLIDLNLRRCGSLEELPESIGNLKYLTLLYLKKCRSMKELPESIGNLKCLTHLHLIHCKSMKELPESIGKLECFKDLNLEGCGSLKELSKSIRKLQCLIDLNIEGCGSLKEL